MLIALATSLWFVLASLCGAVDDVSLSSAAASSMVQKRTHMQTKFGHKFEGGANLGRTLAFTQDLAAKVSGHNYTMTQVVSGKCRNHFARVRSAFATILHKQLAPEGVSFWDKFLMNSSLHNKVSVT